MFTDIVLPAGLELRPAQTEDEPFQEQLFRSTRKHLTQILLDKQVVDTLIQQQFQLQQAYYRKQWPNANTLVVYFSNKPVGKIILDKSETHLHVIDIVIEEAMRGQGLGTSLLRALQVIAAKQSFSITLSVDRENLAAKKLYLALGFGVVSQSDTHEFMVWSSCSVPTDSRSSMALQE